MHSNQQTPLDDLDIIGLKLKKARKYCEKHGWTLRVVIADGKPCMGDFSYKSNRVNVEVLEDIIYDIVEVG